MVRRDHDAAVSLPLPAGMGSVLAAGMKEQIEDFKQDIPKALLTGMPAGTRAKNGAFPKGTLYHLVDVRLRRMA